MLKVFIFFIFHSHRDYTDLFFSKDKVWLKNYTLTGTTSDIERLVQLHIMLIQTLR